MKLLLEELLHMYMCMYLVFLNTFNNGINYIKETVLIKWNSDWSAKSLLTQIFYRGSETVSTAVWVATYRQDGNDDPHGAEHSVIYCLASFQGILDAVIVAVEPSVVRLDGAGLNDQEGQARWSGWNHRTYQKKQTKQNKGKTSVQCG